jgi:two-component system phosphate regulon sensor histidine kinase PhoR/two-component system sensor histidine kinase VicK
MTDRYQEDEDNLNFIAFAAHELRGPITVIRGYLDVLQDELNDILEDDQRELFYRLSVSASRLSGYVNNILNTSRYDQRHLTLSLQPENIATIYAVIADDMSLRASSQNRLLAIDIPNSLPAIAADRASLSEVISNLIDNAIKYSNEGGTVTISATLHGDFVDISVTDQGIGMGADVVKHLFRKFYRSHRSRETVAGSGIGLYISKAIVESHGGTISVRSTEGAGSTFTVSIPTYASIADKLVNGNGNQEIISQGKGWIKNHSIYRG